MSGAWVSLVPCNANNGRRGVMLGGAAMVGCFTLGVGAGPIPFITVALATVTALWLESVASRLAATSQVFTPVRTISRAMPVVAAIPAPPVERCAPPRWEVVECDGEKHLELHWTRE